MNNTMKLLFDEHDIIIGAINSAKSAGALLETDEAAYENTARELIGFFRNYADKYHHYKEEEILFPEMSKRNELLAFGALKEMIENHEDFREMLKEIERSLNEKSYKAAQRQFEEYAEALLDHIAVENDEVFQMVESIFTEDELEKLGFRFSDCDRELGESQKTELENLSFRLKEIL